MNTELIIPTIGRTKRQDRYKLKLLKSYIRHIDANVPDAYIVLKYHVIKKNLVIGSRLRYREHLVKFLTDMLDVDVIPEPTLHQEINLRYEIPNISNNMYDAAMAYAKEIPGWEVKNIRFINRLM